jgi:hypothetical protein
MGILFNVLFVHPVQRILTRQNYLWQRRKDTGEKVFPLKPDSVFLLALMTMLLLTLLFAGITG